MNKLYDNYIKILDRYRDKDEVKNLLDRDIIVCVDNPKNKILLTGINPAWNPQDIKFKTYSFSQTPNKGYWKRYHNLFKNHINDVAYLDLFPLKHSNQLEFEEILKKDINLMIDILQVTQKEIEELSPQLIIIANRRSLPFWGAKKDCVWMGYQFEDVINLIHGKDLIIKKIAGIRHGGESISTLSKTNLIGSYVVFYGLYDERHKCKYPTKILDPEDIDTLLNL